MLGPALWEGVLTHLVAFQSVTLLTYLNYVEGTILSVCRHPRTKVSRPILKARWTDVIVLEGRVATSAELEPARLSLSLSREQCERMCARRLCGRAPALSVGRCVGSSHFSHRKLHIECGQEWKEGGLSSEFVILETHKRAELLPLTARSKGRLLPFLLEGWNLLLFFLLWSYL